MYPMEICRSQQKLFHLSHDNYIFLTRYTQKLNCLVQSQWSVIQSAHRMYFTTNLNQYVVCAENYCYIIKSKIKAFYLIFDFVILFNVIK